MVIQRLPLVLVLFVMLLLCKCMAAKEYDDEGCEGGEQGNGDLHRDFRVEMLGCCARFLEYREPGCISASLILSLSSPPSLHLLRKRLNALPLKKIIQGILQ